MQASLAALGTLFALVAWWQGEGLLILTAALLLGSVIPYTLIVILPTNKQLLDPSLDRSSTRAALLLRRWGRLHLVRSVSSSAAFALLLAAPLL
jgi:uncharacterized membrane protein